MRIDDIFIKVFYLILSQKQNNTLNVKQVS